MGAGASLIGLGSDWRLFRELPVDGLGISIDWGVG